MSELNEGKAADWLKSARAGADLAKRSAKHWARDATLGQKIAALSIAGGATVGGVKRARREWKRDKKKGRLGRTVKGAARGALSGAISGAITGSGVGGAVDYLRGESLDVQNAVHQIMDGRNVEDLIEVSLLKKINFRVKPGKFTTNYAAAAADTQTILGRRKGPKILNIRTRGFFGGRKRRVEKYRQKLWKKHRAEIFMESRRSFDSVMKHKEAIKELVDDLRKGFNSPAPEAAVRDLTKSGMRDKAKIFVNGQFPGTEWSKFDFESWAAYIIKEAAYYAAYTTISYGEAVQSLIGVAYADYVFNKHEPDKDKYVY